MCKNVVSLQDAPRSLARAPKPTEWSCIPFSCSPFHVHPEHRESSREKTQQQRLLKQHNTTRVVDFIGGMYVRKSE
jgi:hypothetical protein